MALVTVFIVILVLVCICTVNVTNGHPHRAHHDEDLDDTFVSLGEEISTGTQLDKRSSLLSDVMGPLKRYVRDVDEHVRSKAVYLRMRALLSILRILLTRGKPRVEIMQFWNWDKTIHIDQLFYVKVRTIWEVRRVILAARILGMRVRATGVGHSRSPLYVDEGNIMMDVRELERHDGPQIELNEKTKFRDFQTVTAMSGVIEVDLNRFLTEHKVAVLSQPINDQDSIGGMVAVSTHGSTWNSVTYSGMVVEIRLMDSRGRLRRFIRERQPEMFKAVMCNLGMFGIMYDITFKGALNVAKSLLSQSYHHVVNAFPLILPSRWGTETSAAFMLNVDTRFDRVARALKFLVNRTEHQIKSRGSTPLNALLPRFFKNHECLLCPGNTDIAMPDDSGHSMVVDFLAPPSQDGFYSAAADFVTEFKSEKIRPHWAKRHDTIVGIVQQIHDVYGKNLEEFNRQRRLAGVDPCDMFMNGYLLTIFGRSKSCFFGSW